MHTDLAPHPPKTDLKFLPPECTNWSKSCRGVSLRILKSPKYTQTPNLRAIRTLKVKPPFLPNPNFKISPEPRKNLNQLGFTSYQHDMISKSAKWVHLLTPKLRVQNGANKGLHPIFLRAFENELHRASKLWDSILHCGKREHCNLKRKKQVLQSFFFFFNFSAPSTWRKSWHVPLKFSCFFYTLQENSRES